MSKSENINALDKQLANLQMSDNSNFNRNTKKVPPAVPPKKIAQPQVPQSAAVYSLREPSYSSRIYPLPNSYGNRDYANVNHYEGLPSNVQNNSFENTTVYNKKYNSDNDTYLKEDIPPPPPPLPSKYNLKQIEEEYIPPSSPVSSNYSELARATTSPYYHQDGLNYDHIYQNEFPSYQASMTPTYESLYEPINLRPTNTSPETNKNRELSGNSPVANKSLSLHKEDEVDVLTNLLVESISQSQELDVFGICVRCKQKVVGESSGCTAMGNMYHVTCFCCYRCNNNLQGKAFYAVDGQPYCETDYYETLEKCSVCDKPILDRILRATGKPYHPACFTCVVCSKSLDGIPFTVDAMNQIHCIDDFHKKFAPRCCVCDLPIMPEEGEEETVRVVALDRSFHVRCYRCEDCGLLLSSNTDGRGCYPLDGHILCKDCNAYRIRLLTNNVNVVMTTDL